MNCWHWKLKTWTTKPSTKTIKSRSWGPKWSTKITKLDLKKDKDHQIKIMRPRPSTKIAKSRSWGSKLWIIGVKNWEYEHGDHQLIEYQIEDTQEHNQDHQIKIKEDKTMKYWHQKLTTWTLRPSTKPIKLWIRELKPWTFNIKSWKHDNQGYQPRPLNWNYEDQNWNFWL